MTGAAFYRSAAALTVECYACGAQVGHRCNDGSKVHTAFLPCSNGGWRTMRTSHAARIETLSAKQHDYITTCAYSAQ